MSHEPYSADGKTCDECGVRLTATLRHAKPRPLRVQQVPDGARLLELTPELRAHYGGTP